MSEETTSFIGTNKTQEEKTFSTKNKIVDLEEFRNLYDDELTLLRMSLGDLYEKELYIDKVRDFLEKIEKQEKFKDYFFAYLYEVSLDKKRAEIFYKLLFENDDFSNQLLLLKEIITKNSTNNLFERIFIKDKNFKGEETVKELQIYIPPLEKVIKEYLNKEDFEALPKEKKDMILFFKTRIEQIKSGNLVCGIDDLTCKIYMLQENLDETITSSKKEILEAVNKISINISSLPKEEKQIINNEKVNEKEEKEDTLNLEEEIEKSLAEKIPADEINEIHTNTENIKYDLSFIKEKLETLEINNENNNNINPVLQNNPSFETEDLEVIKEKIFAIDDKLDKLIQVQTSDTELQTAQNTPANNEFIEQIRDMFGGLEQKFTGIEERMTAIEESVNQVREFINEIDTEEIKEFIEAENEAIKQIHLKLDEENKGEEQ